MNRAEIKKAIETIKRTTKREQHERFLYLTLSGAIKLNMSIFNRQDEPYEAQHYMNFLNVFSSYLETLNSRRGRYNDLLDQNADSPEKDKRLITKEINKIKDKIDEQITSKNLFPHIRAHLGGIYTCTLPHPGVLDSSSLNYQTMKQENDNAQGNFDRMTGTIRGAYQEWLERHPDAVEDTDTAPTPP